MQCVSNNYLRSHSAWQCYNTTARVRIVLTTISQYRQWISDTGTPGPGLHQAATDWEIDRNNSRDCNDREPGADMISPSQASYHCPFVVYVLFTSLSLSSELKRVQTSSDRKSVNPMVALNQCCRWEWELFMRTRISCESSQYLHPDRARLSSPICSSSQCSLLTPQLVTRVTWRHNLTILTSHVTRTQSLELRPTVYRNSEAICIHLSFLFPVSATLFKYDLKVICKITPRQWNI